jgi:hypothetical protein
MAAKLTTLCENLNGDTIYQKTIKKTQKLSSKENEDGKAEQKWYLINIPWSTQK